MFGQASIDGLTFARERRRLEGRIAVAELPRLDEVLFDRSGSVDFVLSGVIGRHGEPVIDVLLSATLTLVCQRCLGSLAYRLERSARLVLYAEGDPLPDVGEEDPDSEAIAVGDVSEVAELIEQEIILGLPIAPLHADGMCKLEHDVLTEPRESPFAVLRRIKAS